MEVILNHLLWPLQSSDLNQFQTCERFWRTLSSTIIKTPTEGTSVRRMVFINSVLLQKLVETLPSCNEAVLA